MKYHSENICLIAKHGDQYSTSLWSACFLSLLFWQDSIAFAQQTDVGRETPPVIDAAAIIEEMGRVSMEVEDTDKAVPESVQAEYEKAWKSYYDFEVWRHGYRRRIFEWQLSSSKYIFWVVIFIVSLGVAMSALHFIDSFQMFQRLPKNMANRAAPTSPVQGASSPTVAASGGTTVDPSLPVGETASTVTTPTSRAPANEASASPPPVADPRHSADVVGMAVENEKETVPTQASETRATNQLAASSTVSITKNVSPAGIQLEASTTGIKLNTSLIGLALLAMSLMFFYLYLAYVYPIVQH